jgi:alpha-L-fucosidase
MRSSGSGPHWSAQCVPEQGDWYGRIMYMQGSPQYEYHLKTYGHPSKFGFMEIDNLWKAERWEPEKLMALYKRAGAKYFFALANHHDNFDTYDSKYHAWNSVNIGPKKDIIGTWAKVARAEGLRFGVSNHSAHAWHWFQVAYGYDAEGPLAGARYDAARLTKADCKGKWWEGLDRHLHRLVALQPRNRRAQQVQDRQSSGRHAARHREQERQPDAERAGAR